MLHIDYAYYPDIIDSVFAYAPYRSLLSLRTTCRKLRDRVDHHLVRHLALPVSRDTRSMPRHPHHGHQHHYQHHQSQHRPSYEGSLDRITTPGGERIPLFFPHTRSPGLKDRITAALASTRVLDMYSMDCPELWELHGWAARGPTGPLRLDMVRHVDPPAPTSAVAILLPCGGIALPNAETLVVLDLALTRARTRPTCLSLAIAHTTLPTSVRRVVVNITVDGEPVLGCAARPRARPSTTTATANVDAISAATATLRKVVIVHCRLKRDGGDSGRDRATAAVGARDKPLATGSVNLWDRVVAVARLIAGGDGGGSSCTVVGLEQLQGCGGGSAGADDQLVSVSSSPTAPSRPQEHGHHLDVWDWEWDPRGPPFGVGVDVENENETGTGPFELVSLDAYRREVGEARFMMETQAVPTVVM